MKTLHVFLVATCLVACARGFPSIGGYDSDEADDFETSFDFAWPSYFSDMMNSMLQRFRDAQNLFKFGMGSTGLIPDGANTTSTTKIINGHVVTINETTYSSGDDTSGTAFRVRVIDIKPLNSTDTTLPPTTVVGGNAQPTVKPETNESRETVEDFNNEISKSTDTLTA